MKRKIIISTLAVILIAITSVFWMEGCRKPVEPIEILNTEEIIKELSEANTPEKAEIAINHLIEKVGIGIIKENSDYELYVIDEDQIESLAIAQSGFVNGDSAINIGTYYNIFSSFQDTLEILTNDEYQFNSTLSKSLHDLQEDAKVAINNMEAPNNAIITYIIAENGEIPSEIQLYDSLVIVSPVQSFCFNIWNANKYGEYSIIKTTNIVNLSGCQLACIAAGSACAAVCSAATGFWGTAACIFACSAATAWCLESCHDQGGGK